MPNTTMVMTRIAAAKSLLVGCLHREKYVRMPQA